MPAQMLSLDNTKIFDSPLGAINDTNLICLLRSVPSPSSHFTQAQSQGLLVSHSMCTEISFGKHLTVSLDNRTFIDFVPNSHLVPLHVKQDQFSRH